MPLSPFHPAVANWFAEAFVAPTDVQAAAWPAIAAGRATLIAAPTGSGKTLAAFLTAIDNLVRRGLDGRLEDACQVLYVSPLKALSNDVERNLGAPLAGIRAQLAARGLPDVPLRAAVRTGDTPSHVRQQMLRQPPHILVTTPESLYLLLTSEGGRRLLEPVRTVIVDEIHALVADKRGAHLALSLARLDRVAARPPVRLGLSATQRPVDEVARFLVGGGGVAADGTPDCAIVDLGHRRALDLDLELMDTPLGAVMATEAWDEMVGRLAALIEGHRTTLIFVNTRRHAERLSHELESHLGPDAVMAHHGSMARAQRFDAEQRLKAGQLRALVATASLELGIDVGAIELVVQIGTPKTIAALLQRIGRAGHAVGGTAKGRLIPLSRDDLVAGAALVAAVRRGELDTLQIPPGSLDVLAQQLVAEVAAGDTTADALFELARTAWPYRALDREAFDRVVAMLHQGFTTRRGRRGAHLLFDAATGALRGRRGARLMALTNGGAIPDTFDYDVVLMPEGVRIGAVDEDFAIESMAGDVFQLGNASWRVLGVETGTVRVADAAGQAPSMPFWFGEAPARSEELSGALSWLRQGLSDRLATAPGAAGRATAEAWLCDDLALPAVAAAQIVAYLAAAHGALGLLPTQTRIVAERFFDDAGDQHLVLHAPLGARLNRAWGLALRKSFCRSFNFELQAAATEEAIILSLGPTHSFPLADVFQFLSPATVRTTLIQALLDAPMFAVRWRWNATRALAVARRRGGKKVAPQLQRMAAEDLLTLVFPDQVACLENIQGDRQIPEHPLVQQTIDDCLHEAMDIERLEALLGRLRTGEIEVVARDLREPSPLALEILHARPYAFLDDAPLEERRVRAVAQRRWLDPEQASELGRLEPAAIAQVRQQAWPQVRDADELLDALIWLGYVTATEGARGHDRQPWTAAMADLERRSRAARVELPGGTTVWLAAEWQPALAALQPQAHWSQPLVPPPAAAPTVAPGVEPLAALLAARLQGTGPVTADGLAAQLALPASRIAAALAALEAEGSVMAGDFDRELDGPQWCERHLLMRIHRATIGRLRAEIEPVSPAVFQRFLLGWQQLGTGDHRRGPEGVVAALEQLSGVEAPAAAWESDLLPARVADYDPAWLDRACQGGRVAWGRLRPGERAGAGPVKATPMALVVRAELPAWLQLARGAAPTAPTTPEATVDAPAGLSPDAGRLAAWLRNHGASFYDDLVAGTGLLASRAEAALGELVAAGGATADSFTGLRALMTPSQLRPVGASGRRGRRRARFGVADAGRWSAFGAVSAAADPATAAARHAAAVETAVAALLRRYGVIVRAVVAREPALPPWRDLLKVLRRWEARGEVRGGRFVHGFAGEQFAVPEAVAALRAARRAEAGGDLAVLHAADPLNLHGLAEGVGRVPAVGTNRVLFRDGLAVALREAGEVRVLVADADPADRWAWQQALTASRTAAKLRAYLGGR